ncbi:MAG: C40 family peptidase [Candidatus Eisenbacteria bacterium]
MGEKDLLELVRERVREIAGSADRRYERLEVIAHPRGGGVALEGYATSESLVWSLRSLLDREGIRADDRAIELLDRASPTRRLVAVSAVVHLRDEPDPRSALLTQCVLGEEMDGLVEKGKWVLVRTGDGYLGWCSRRGVAAPGDEYERLRAERRHFRVIARETLLLGAPSGDAFPVREAAFDSHLIGRTRKGSWIEVLFADGAVGWVREEAVRPDEEIPRRPSPETVLETAKRMIGVPYLWGGTSPKGFDCSGLVHRVFGHHGVSLPRDADRMKAALEPTWVGKEAAPGDLLFFGAERLEHVAISLGGSEIIHASGWVRMESLDPASTVYREDLEAVWIGAGRVPGLAGREARR